jgi:hypothetical protein
MERSVIRGESQPRISSGLQENGRIEGKHELGRNAASELILDVRADDRIE